MLLVIPMLSNTPQDERNRILQMVESGQVTATEAAQLLDALEQDRQLERVPSRKDRVLRVRVTSLNAKNQKVYLTAALPVNLIRTSLRLGIRLIPQLNESALENLLQSVESESMGRILDLQDMEKGERLEIFVA
jgi:DNA-binding MarR family transcriptional regulator